MMKTDFENMLASLEGQLTDDAVFMANLEHNMDFMEQAKQRNDQMAAKSRRLLMSVVICGILVSTVIISLSLLYDPVSFYSGLYALTAACLSSTIIFATVKTVSLR